jgi:hypothetical protein
MAEFKKYIADRDIPVFKVCNMSMCSKFEFLAGVSMSDNRIIYVPRATVISDLYDVEYKDGLDLKDDEKIHKYGLSSYGLEECSYKVETFEGKNQFMPTKRRIDIWVKPNNILSYDYDKIKDKWHYAYQVVVPGFESDKDKLVYPLVYVECEIPKSTGYYKNKYGEYVSERLRVRLVGTFNY